MSNKRETRFYGELRASSSNDDGAKKISGYAAVYGVETVIANQFREVLLPGCFDKTVADQDECQCFFNHDPNFPLGRVASGTLKLRADDKGLFYETTLPNTQVAADVWESVHRKDVVGASFGFWLVKDNWIPATKPGELPLREILEAQVFDVSPCSQPQYTDGPTANARSLFPDGVPAGIAARAMDTGNSGALIPVGGPVSFHKHAEKRDDLWDEEDAVNGIVKWATEDEGDRAAGTRVNLSKLAQGFAYVDGEGRSLSDYKLPHHVVADGKLAHHFTGSLRALGTLAFGKSGVPENRCAEVRQHLLDELNVFNGDYEDGGNPETEIERSRLRLAVAKLL